MLKYLKKDPESNGTPALGASFQQKKKDREEKTVNLACNSKNGALTVFMFDGISQNV